MHRNMDILPDEIIEKILFLTNNEDMITFCEVSKRSCLLGKEKFIPYIVKYLQDTKNWYLGKTISLSRLKVLCNDVTSNYQLWILSNNYYTLIKGNVIKFNNHIINSKFEINIIKIFNVGFGELLYLKYDGTVFNSSGKILGLENIIHIEGNENNEFIALSGDGDVFISKNNKVEQSVKDVINIFFLRDGIYFLKKDGSVIPYNGKNMLSDLKQINELLRFNMALVILNRDGKVYYYSSGYDPVYIGLNNIKHIYNVGYYFANFIALSYNGELSILMGMESRTKNIKCVKGDLFNEIIIPINYVEDFKIGLNNDLIVLTKDKYLYVLDKLGYNPNYVELYKEQKLLLQGGNINLLPGGLIRIDNKLYDITTKDSDIILIPIV